MSSTKNPSAHQVVPHQAPAHGVSQGMTTIPFGPQHPVLPEPLHFDLTLEDEKIVDAIPQIGYIHRGLELLVEKRDFADYVHVAERVCGICSFMHGMGYSEAIESIMGVVVPDRARWLRTFWCELERSHSHLMWLGLAADAFGFENLFHATWRAREIILDVAEETAGGRVIYGSCIVGGVSRDPDNETLLRCAKELDKVRDEVARLAEVFVGEPTVRSRLEGVGVLSKDKAYALGAVGPMLRASGVEYDMRKKGYEAYPELDFTPMVETAGDSMARAKVRIREIGESLRLVHQVAERLPGGPVSVPVKGLPSGDAWIRVEQPRGEALYFVRANGKKNPERFRLRTPTFANIPAMVEAMKGEQLADVPTIVLTIDPCISCTER